MHPASKAMRALINNLSSKTMQVSNLMQKAPEFVITLPPFFHFAAQEEQKEARLIVEDD